MSQRSNSAGVPMDSAWPTKPVYGGFASPFAQHAGRELLSHTSCPVDLQAPPPSPPKTKDGLREQFTTPEALDGFTVQAYRPCSLPLQELLEEEEPEEAGGLAIPHPSLAAPLQWKEVDAVSLVGSPPMLRTDIPLSRFAPPVTRRPVAAARRMSMDEVVRSGRAFLELSARSASAPASYNTLVVDDLWAGVPAPAVANPFDGLADTCGFFQH